MIHDSLNQSSAYEKLHPLFPLAFAWLKKFNPQTPDGKYPIQGDDLVAGVQRYLTKPSEEKKWEAHRIFGDIQVIFSGEEICGHHPTTALTSMEAYQAGKDVEKFAAPSAVTTSLHLRPGYFTIFYPSDGHQPGVMAKHPTEVLKVVIKFRLV